MDKPLEITHDQIEISLTANDALKWIAYAMRATDALRSMIKLQDRGLTIDHEKIKRSDIDARRLSILLIGEEVHRNKFYDLCPQLGEYIDLNKPALFSNKNGIIFKIVKCPHEDVLDPEFNELLGNPIVKNPDHNL